MRQPMFVTLVLMLGCAFCAVAEDAAAPPDRFAAMFKQADANQDGKVTFEEASAAFPQVTQEQFARYDRNGDGAVTPADRPAGPHGGPEGKMAMLAQADADGDGKVTYEELKTVAPGIPEERFNHLDRNGDGVLSQADAPKGPHGPGKPGPKGGKMALLKKADANGDKQVTFEELTAVAPGITRERFDKTDRNNDGVLSPADAPEGPPLGPEGAAPKRPRAPDERGSKGDRMAMLKQADTNNDQQITFDELSALAPNVTRERFDKMDRNGDGALTPADRPADRPHNPERRKAMAQKLQQADADGDGKVTYEEVTTAKPGFPREAFDRFDRNGDGVLTEEDAHKKK